ncbi:DUF6012 family protein [Serratia symbiotica]|uniref:DUF6012 family protein n=1 Tax=Serratia symbiotica TaxID=138074 RepID=UPI0013276BD0|nr:DUF6012 family protein [Serratia symbiotica]QTP13399.1 hypothetical protein GPZ83_0000225 [Serratia symbiotica]
MSFYYHLVPRFTNNTKAKCKLMSLAVPEFGLKLDSGSLSTVRPFPNKSNYVGMPKGKKATVGLLVQTQEKHKSFTMISKWQVEGFKESTHILHTYVDDELHDLVSHSTLLCVGYGKANEQVWGYRVHPSYENQSPAVIDPRMENVLTVERDLAHDVYINYPWGDFILEREESYLAVTIPSERLNNEHGISFFDKYPPLNSAIKL